MSTSENTWNAGLKTALIALPILYVLSIGPAVYVLERSGLESDPVVAIVLTVYYPLDLLYQKTPLRIPLQWYIDHWREY